MTNNKKIHFEISERKILLRIFDIIFVFLALFVVGQLFDLDYFHISLKNPNWNIVLGFYLLFFGTLFEMYNLQVASNSTQIIRSILLTAIATVIVYLLTPILSPPLPKNRLQILVFLSAIFIALLVWRLVYQKFLASHRFHKKVLFLGDIQTIDTLVNDLEHADPNYKVMGFLNTDYTGKGQSKLPQINFKEIEEYIASHTISEVVIAQKDTESVPAEVYNKLLFLLEKGITIREYTQVYETSTHRLPVQYAEKDFYRYFPFSRSNSNKLYVFSIRFFDICVALLGLLIGLLVAPIVLLGNYIGNRGPLFYSQERVGKNGIPFTIYKFRSMIVNAEKNGACFAQVNDSRITPFGKFLRKSRLDEFPQFINILKGEMSVIGPRPERPVFVDELSQIMPFYATRHIIKPGLTGWAQVKHSYGETLDDSLIKLQYDLYYIKHRSPFLDINIIIKTLSTVLFYRGQ